MNLLSDATYVVDVVSRHYDITLDELLGESRRPEFAYPRLVVYWLLYKRGHVAQPEIARLMQRDASTVFSGVRRVDERLRAEADERESMLMLLSGVGQVEVPAGTRAAQAIREAQALVRELDGLIADLEAQRADVLALLGRTA